MRQSTMTAACTLMITAAAAAPVMAAPDSRGQAGAAKQPAIRACSLLPKAEVKKIVAPGDELFDMIPPTEDSLGGGGSACNYASVTVQIDPFTPARLEGLRKEKGAQWTAVPSLGDAAYLFDNKNAGGHYAELYTRAGQHVVTIQLSVRPDTAPVETARPAAIELTKALLAKLR